MGNKPTTTTGSTQDRIDSYLKGVCASVCVYSLTPKHAYRNYRAVVSRPAVKGSNRKGLLHATEVGRNIVKLEGGEEGGRREECGEALEESGRGERRRVMVSEGAE